MPKAYCRLVIGSKWQWANGASTGLLEISFRKWGLARALIRHGLEFMEIPEGCCRNQTINHAPAIWKKSIYKLTQEMMARSTKTTTCSSSRRGQTTYNT